MKNARGFSLLELLIVVAIIAIIGAVGSGFYTNYGKNIGIKSTAQTIVFDLKNAQSKSMIGEGGFKWGVHFENGAIDYYEIFSTPTDYNDGAKVIFSKNYLTDNIVFSSASKDIIFQKIKGGIDTSSTGGGTADISVIIQSVSLTKTVTVSMIGNISAQ